MNISIDIIKAVSAAASQHGASRVLLYGSRARGDNRPESDVDLAIFGMPAERRSSLLAAFDDIPTLIDFDVVFVTSDTDPALMRNILKDGVLIMGKFEEKFEKFKSAVARLSEAVADYEKNPLDSIRDGVIQRFEFCTELAWKCTREYLEDEGFTELDSPKSVMRRAYAGGLIENDSDWIELLTARNKTSHIYDEATAEEIFGAVCRKYAAMFAALIEKLENNQCNRVPERR